MPLTRVSLRAERMANAAQRAARHDAAVNEPFRFISTAADGLWLMDERRDRRT